MSYSAENNFIYGHMNVVPGRGASKVKFPHENARNPTLFQSRVIRTSESIEKLLTKMIQVVTRGDTVCVSKCKARYRIGIV